uniref:Ovule protein n=1 Tax=Echinococcus granulosus TaxID=6210 RepID=A0A068WFZ7_ECHGR|nr:hypothetical protein EgrG_000901200 [Echinococcus granulosus]
MSLFHGQLSRARVPHPEPTRTEAQILLQSHPRYLFATIPLSIRCLGIKNHLSIRTLTLIITELHLNVLYVSFTY